jgi:uncharacterized protein YkwD
MRRSPAFLALPLALLSAHLSAEAQLAPARTPTATPATKLLAEINAARAVARDCGAVHYDAAPPLATSARPLTRVAASQASSMATSGALAHTPGLTSALTAAGYKATVALDLVAGDSGSGTPAATVANWLASPQHCAVVMDPQWVDLGAGQAVSAASSAPLRQFWIAVFAKP